MSDSKGSFIRALENSKSQLFRKDQQLKEQQATIAELRGRLNYKWCGIKLLDEKQEIIDTLCDALFDAGQVVYNLGDSEQAEVYISLAKQHRGS